MRSTLNFNSHWQFTKPGAAPVAVTLPHTWNAADGTDGGKSSGKTSSKPADENKNSTDSSNGGALDKLSSIKDGLSCPVDLKKFM